MEHNVPGTMPESVLQWLEEEQRQNKATLFRIQQQLEQLQNTAWALTDRVNALEGAISTVMGHATRLAHAEEEARQAKEALDRLNAALEGHLQAVEAEERSRLAEAERDRVARAELTQKLDAVARIQENVQDRILAQEELHRKTQHELFQLATQLDPLRAQDERMLSLITALQAQVKRQDSETDQLRKEQESLHQQDEVLQGRILHLVDQVRRIEGNTALHDLEERFSQDLRELSELSRVERQRLERLIADLELGYDQSRTNIENLQQESIQTAGRVQAFADHLEHLRQQMWELRTDVANTLSAVASTQEQHYRRALAELELQIRELGQWRIAPPRT